MSPPTVIINADKIKIPNDCTLKQLIQHECEVYGKEVVCEPLIRLFKCCEKNNKQTLYEITKPRPPNDAIKTLSKLVMERGEETNQE